MAIAFTSAGARAIVLGPPGLQRVIAVQTLLGFVVYLLFALMQHAEALLGLIDLQESNALSAFNLTGGLLFYAVVRSGWNEVLARRLQVDSGLTLLQTGFAVLASAGSYSITGPARGSAMSLMLLLMAFAMFSLRPRESRNLALFGLASLFCVMAWKCRTEPARYPPAVEAIHAVWASIVTGGLIVLAGRMGRLRMRLQSQKAELQQALETIGELATRDELTGLANRRRMGEVLAAEQQRQRGAEAKMTLALLDIDLFKRINDQHGHSAGDVVLRRFAEVGRSVIRPDDVLARWGGEEFLLMLPRTTPAQALQIVDRLRETLAGVPFDGIAPALRVTFSSGLAACDDDEPLDTCIERADQAMYRAKTQGRNRCVLA